jgi:preprotein translocase subunit SecA
MVTRALRVGEGRKFKGYEKRAEAINQIEPEMELLDDPELRAEADALRKRAVDGESLDDLLPEAFALTREAARRSIGQRHYDVQLIGGMALHEGAIAEMKTGEGKTLTATLAVFLNTLAGNSVHLVTVNDYLARRDAEWMKPIYDMLGVRVAAVQEGDDHATRQAKYACDVVYGTNSEFGFAYLRDNMAEALEHCVQPGHSFAIVDEVDNILIDEARTPLIISGAPEQAAQTYYTFARLARQMEGVPAKDRLRSLGESKDTSEADYDYEFDEKHKTVSPTERGVKKAEEFVGVDNLYLGEHGSLVNHLVQALKAEALYKRDTDYAVIDGRGDDHRRVHRPHPRGAALVGGPAPGGRGEGGGGDPARRTRPWRRSPCRTTSASTTSSRDDRHRPDRGDRVHEDLQEPGGRDPDHQPMVRLDQNDQIFKTKGRQVEGRCSRRSSPATRRGQPILVGTVSVEVSEMISEALKRDGIEHAVLNAKARARRTRGRADRPGGPQGAVMIATNMAGRGVDIKLGGDPEHWRSRAEEAGISPATRLRGGAGGEDAELEPQCKAEARRSASSAASSSAAPSATSRGASTTSSAAAPAARATRASRASSSPPKTT